MWTSKIHISKEQAEMSALELCVQSFDSKIEPERYFHYQVPK